MTHRKSPVFALSIKIFLFAVVVFLVALSA